MPPLPVCLKGLKVDFGKGVLIIETMCKRLRGWKLDEEIEHVTGRQPLRKGKAIFAQHCSASGHMSQGYSNKVCEGCFHP